MRIVYERDGGGLALGLRLGDVVTPRLAREVLGGATGTVINFDTGCGYRITARGRAHRVVFSVTVSRPGA